MRDNFKRRIRAIISCALIFALCFIATVPAFAAKSDTKTVKVGYYESERFQEGANKESPKSGYAYEYLQAVRGNTNWKYEYVYGSFDELYKKLIAGEIDLLAGINYTSDSASKISYPDSRMGQSSRYIYKVSYDDGLISGDINSLTGKKIGAVSGSSTLLELNQWAETNSISINIVEYESYETCKAGLLNGKIDGMIASEDSVISETGLSAVFKVATSPYYLCVSNSRPDLLSDLNSALAKISESNPRFVDDLYSKFYKNTVVSNTLSAEEEKWVETHDSITVGYLDDYLPFSDEENGKVTGVILDVIEQMINNLDIGDQIKIKYVAFDAYEDMLKALSDGTVDVIFPVGGGLWRSEQSGIYQSNAVVTTGMNLAYRGTYSDEKLNRIAVNKNNLMQYYYTTEYYPDAEIVYVESVEGCLEAVKNNTADSTIINGLRTTSILSNSKYKEIKSIELNQTDDFCFGVSSENSALLQLINHGISTLEDDYAVATSYKYLDSLVKYTFADFVRNNIFVVLLFLIVITFAVIVISTKRINDSRERAKREELLKNELSEALTTAQDANRAKTVFLNSMSHDIRTPMNAIIGFTQLATKHIDDKSAVADYLSKITTSSSHLLNLINDMLDMSRIESGRVKLDESECHIPTLIDELKNILQGEVSAKNLEFNIDYSRIENEYVFCDKLRVNQIFLNCLGNSIKFTEKGGVGVKVIERHDAPTGYAHYDFVLSDTGIGMSQEFVERIFEPFSREETSTVSKITGTGLGMSITKNLVDMMGGTILVKSEKGVGSEFTIALCFRIANEHSLIDDKKKDEIVTDFTGKKILLVEDNELNMEIATEIITETGATVIQAEDGEDAVEKFLESELCEIDLIFMDIQMPKMDGYQATKEIRVLKREDAKNIPIVAMTANAFIEDRKLAFEAGMNDHLAKPIDLDKLYEIMNKFLYK